MYFSTIQYSKDVVYTDSLSRQSSTQTNKSTVSSSTDAYTVSLSPLSKKAEEHVNNILKTCAVPDSAVPVEDYGIPQWQGDMIPDELFLDGTLGVNYADSNSYKYDSLSSKKKDEYQEYVMTLNEYVNEEKELMGIKDSVDYYYKCMEDDELSEKLQQAVLNRIADDPRMMELMRSVAETNPQVMEIMQSIGQFDQSSPESSTRRV